MIVNERVFVRFFGFYEADELGAAVDEAKARYHRRHAAAGEPLML